MTTGLRAMPQRSGVKIVLNLCQYCRLSLQRQSSTCPWTGEKQDTAYESNSTISQLTAPQIYTKPRQSTKHEPYKDVPGPKSYPVIGTLYKYLPKVGTYSLLDQMGTDLKRYKEFGSLVREQIFPGFTVYHVYDPDLIHLIYDKERMYPERFPLPGLTAYRELRKTSKGIALKTGKEWREERSAANDLMRPNYITKFFSEQIHIAEDFNQLIAHSTNERQEITDSLHLCYQYALESVANAMFGKRLGILEPNLSQTSEAVELMKAIKLAMDSLYHTTYFWPLHKNKRTKVWKNLCDSIDYITQVVQKYVDEDPVEHNVSFMKTFLSKPGLTTNDVLTLLTDVIFAGVDSTALVMLYNMYNLAKNPEKQEILYQEVCEHLPQGEPLTKEAMDKMKYLKAVMKETFRVNPLGVGNARILTQDLDINGHHIPEKSLMLLNSTVACQSPEYVPDPGVYLPERWLPDAQPKLHPCLILPFGLGARSCLGRRLSTLELKIALIKMIQTFRFEYNQEEIGYVTRFSNTPDRLVQFRVTKRA